MATYLRSAAFVGALGLSFGCGGANGTDVFSIVSDGGADAAAAQDGGGAGGSADGGTGVAPGGNLTSLPCGSATCAVPAQVCCAYPAPNGTDTFDCLTGSSCPSRPNTNGSVMLHCTGASNCPANTVCCIRSTNGNGVTSSCQTTCGGGAAQLCDPTASQTGCAPNMPCSSADIASWGLPASFGTCGGKGN